MTSDTENRVRDLEARGEWMALRSAGDILLSSTGHDVASIARVHASLSVAFTKTATSADDWRAALYHAHRCYQLAPKGSSLFAWSLAHLSSVSVNTNRNRQASFFARAFLAVAGEHSSLASFVPHALRDLSTVHYRERHFAASVTLRRRALTLFESIGNTDEARRTRINLAWALLRLGRINEAEKVLPDDDSASDAHLVDGLRAGVALRRGDWSEALRLGRRALLESSRLPCDLLDAAEVALIVSVAATRLRQTDTAATYRLQVSQLASRQGCEASVVLLLTRRGEGGEKPHDVSEARGSADIRDRGTFTTGVA